MTERPIRAQWESYRAKVLRGAPQGQLTAHQCAFYAGAIALYSMLINKVSPGDDIIPADMDMMAAVRRDLQQFPSDVIQDHLLHHAPTEGSA